MSREERGMSKRKKITVRCEKGLRGSHSSFLISHSLAILLLFVFCLPSSVYAGTIEGRALFDGAPGENPKVDMSADPVCKSLNPETAFQQRIVVNSNGTLKNVFVYVKEGVSGKTFPVPTAPAVLD